MNLVTRRALCVGLLLNLLSATAFAQYTENFNALPTSGTGGPPATTPWLDNATLPGWYFVSQDVAFVRNLRIGTGSDNAGGIYSFATGALPADRALGSLGSGGTDSMAYALVLRNTSGSPISNPVITYTGEQYRNGDNANSDTLLFTYGVFGSIPTLSWAINQSGFTAVAALNFTGPIASDVPSALALDGNGAANRVTPITATLTGVTINPNEYLVLKWHDKNDGGNDHAVALDDLTVSGTGWATPAAPTPTLSFARPFYHDLEGNRTYTIPVNVDLAPNAASSVTVTPFTTTLVPNVGGLTPTTEYTVSPTTLNFASGVTTPQNITVTLTGDATAEPTEYLGLRLTTPTGNVQVGSADTCLIFVYDDDYTLTAAGTLTTTYVGSFRNNTGVTGNPPDNFTAEIVAHDPLSQRIFIANGARNSVNVVDVSNAPTFTHLGEIVFSFGQPNSVAVSNGVLAVAVQNGGGVDTDDDRTTRANVVQPGRVYLFNAATTTFTEASALANVTVGALPDMVTFTPNGQKVLVANEGEPSDYAAGNTDPEGSVSVITLPANFLASGGTPTVSTLVIGSATPTGSNTFNSSGRTYAPQGSRGAVVAGTTLAQDLEPEYIAVSADGNTAYVTLQENNAVAVLDISGSTPTLTHLRGLGEYDFDSATRAFDASDRRRSTNDNFFLGTWPVVGQPMPDAIATANIGGTQYYFTANEGDAREYQGSPNGGADEARLSAFTPASALTATYRAIVADSLVGRLNVDYLGDTDLDGDLDELRMFGTRSFSIRNATTGALVYDSGSDFERITATDSRSRAFFNASNTNGTVKDRSDNKGPEPEAITVAQITRTGQSTPEWFAFIGLERTGGVMIYNVTNPLAPVYDGYLLPTTRTTTVNTTSEGMGPEDIKFVQPNDSPVANTALLLVANEVSGTIDFYSFGNIVTDNERPSLSLGTLEVAPNPVTDYLHLRGNAPFGSRTVEIDVRDLRGAIVKSFDVVAGADGAIDERLYVGELTGGLYVVTLQQGGRASSVRIVKQ